MAPLWVTPPWLTSHFMGFQSLSTLGIHCPWRTLRLSRQLHIPLLGNVLCPATCGAAMGMYLIDQPPSPLSSDATHLINPNLSLSQFPVLQRAFPLPKPQSNRPFRVQLLSPVSSTSLKSRAKSSGGAVWNSFFIT